MQFYTDESREELPTALPDAEVFYMSAGEIADYGPDSCWYVDGEPLEPGWYYWACLPGCLPDGEPVGPFESESAAIADARDSVEG